MKKMTKLMQVTMITKTIVDENHKNVKDGKIDVKVNNDDRKM